MAKLSITNRFTGAVIYEAEASTIAKLLACAVRGADLGGAETGNPALGLGREHAIIEAEITSLRRPGQDAICRCGRTIPAGWGLTLDNQEWMCPNCFLQSAEALPCERRTGNALYWLGFVIFSAAIVWGAMQ